VSQSRTVAATFIKGFLMGSADVVPGVSGGTVALVTGIYPTLVGAISTGSQALEKLVRGSIREALATLRRVPWMFLVPLVLGAAVAVLTLAGVLETLIVEQPIRTAATFFGLIAGTIVVAWQLITRPSATHAAIVAVVGGATFALFGLQGAATLEPALWAYFAAGAVAICAFILPGVSGSFLLLSLGMYQAVLGAVSDRELPVILVFGLGATISLAFFSRLLERLLERHHDMVTAALVGLMLGSVRILWPWPNGLGDADGVGATILGAPRGDIAMPVLLAIIGAVVVVAVGRLAHRPGSATTTGRG
jgi:putative membrane protein